MAVRKLTETDVSCIRDYIVCFFRMDTGYEGYCALRDLSVDEEYDEAFADVQTPNGWYSTYLKYEKRIGLDVLPVDFGLSNY